MNGGRKIRDSRSAGEDAIETGTDLLEDDVRRRAVDGVEEPLFHQGKKVGLTRKYSDTLLIFLLKARRPAKYRDSVRLEHIDVTQLTTEQLEDIVAGRVPRGVKTGPPANDESYVH